MHLLFVCTGNVCRSPFAERYSAVVARQRDLRDWTFSSAGTGALVGAPMEPEMAAELDARGGDATGFQARQVDGRVLRDCDLVVTMEVRQRQVLLDDFPRVFRRIYTLTQLAHTIAALDPELHGADLLREAGVRRAQARENADIADPYHKGREEASRCAAQIVTLLDSVLPRLG